MIAESFCATITSYYFRKNGLFLAIECFIWLTVFGFLASGLHRIRKHMRNEVSYTINYKAFTLLFIAISLAIMGQIPLMLLTFMPESKPNYDRIYTAIYVMENIIVFVF
jgi:hypothetical protein